MVVGIGRDREGASGLHKRSGSPSALYRQLYILCREAKPWPAPDCEILFQLRLRDEHTKGVGKRQCENQARRSVLFQVRRHNYICVQDSFKYS